MCVCVVCVYTCIHAWYIILIEVNCTTAIVFCGANVHYNFPCVCIMCIICVFPPQSDYWGSHLSAPHPPHPPHHHRGGSSEVVPSFRYDPAKTCFKQVSNINPRLLQDVINCYKRGKAVCRQCFFRSQNQVDVVNASSGQKKCIICKSSDTVLVMPASKLCENSAGLNTVAVPPPPSKLLAADSM